MQFGIEWSWHEGSFEGVGDGIDSTGDSGIDEGN
jgi:hypothetical protein